MLTLRFRLGINATAPRKQIGIPRLTQKASRMSRNSASTTKTSMNPAAPFSNMIASRSVSTSDWSCQTVSLTPSGNQASARRTKSRTAAATSSALWSPERYTDTVTAGSSSKRARWSVSAKPSTTVATSPSSRRLPSGRVQSTRRS